MARQEGRGEHNTLVYYLGSKQRMASAVEDAIDEVAAGDEPVADLFAGVGSASCAIARQHDVVAVDTQEYARVICSALLEEAHAPALELPSVMGAYNACSVELQEAYEPLLSYEEDALSGVGNGRYGALSGIVEHGCMLVEYRADVPHDLALAMRRCEEKRRMNGIEDDLDAIVRYFGGTYFSYEQAIGIASARASAMQAGDAWRNTLLAATLSAASHCVSAVGGQFAQPIKTVDASGRLKESAIRQAASCRRTQPKEVFLDAIGAICRTSRPRRGNLAVRSEGISYLRSQGDDAYVAIYADPPYSRYHYSRYYHVLETIVLGDQPVVTTNPATGRPSRGIYRAGRYQSPFSTLGGAPKAFEELFAECSRCSPSLVLSYSPYPEGGRSTPRMVTIDTLIAFARSRYSHVELRYVEGVTHSKLNAANAELEVSPHAEVMIICRR